MTTTWTEDNTILKKYAYIYHYDQYNRCVYKKLPGCEPIYTVYDAADRAIFTQDGNQRDKGEWSFSVPDAFNRVVLTGTCKNTMDYTSTPLGNLVVKAIRMREDNTLKGYTVPEIDLNTPTVLSANYYDTYDFLGFNGIPNNATTAYTEVAGYGKRSPKGCKGQLTGTWTASLSGNSVTTQPVYTVMYYDGRYRLIQQKGNTPLNGTEQVYTAYNFEGSPTEEKHVRTVPGQATLTEIRQNTYDLANRLLKTVYRLDDNAPILLVDNVYDEIGRLKADKRNGHPNLRTGYDYNIRSWTKKVNSPLFSQTLNYQESPVEGVEGVTGNIPRYNGNISNITWRAGQITNGKDDKGYRFTYDKLGRLKDALYGEGGELTTNPNRFNEQVLEYDKMGNILGLLRYGQTSATNYGLVDNLNLTYNGNQLQSVSDNATSPVFGNGTEFKDKTNQTIEYTYDKSGNLSKDLNKNITVIQYNLLNLPSRVTFGDGNSVEYVYDANGTKLRTKHTIQGTATTTDYCGNSVYENGVLKTILNEAGYYSFQDKKFHFHLKDHQGNVRVVADQNGSVEETNEYYPFGGLFTNTANVQPYKYNGKELDTKNGLDWYDYGARHYDAAIGRWCAVDPMSECLHDLSSYQYAKNNPVRFTDPTGMMPVDSVNWKTFDSNQDVIDLQEVQVTAASPFSIQTIGGSSYSVNVFTGSRRFIGEAGLQNVSPEFDLLLFSRFLVGQGVKAGVSQAGRIAASRTAANKLSQSAIEKGIQYAMNPTKVSHIFEKAAHNLGPLTTKLGGPKNVYAATLNALNDGGYLAASTISREVTINIGGSNVAVRFVVHDGIPKIGTMYIP